MRTITDIEKMKKTNFEPFGTEYEYMVETLFDWYIAKLDGEDRIKNFLSDWDEPAQERWLDALNERVICAEEEFYESQDD